jgi:ATP-binding cassette subfamily B protein
MAGIIPFRHFEKKAGFNKAGVSLLGISETAEKIGFRSRGVTISYDQLKEAVLPCILHWNQNHFVVLLSISNRDKVKIADPARGILTYPKDEFLNHWISRSSVSGDSESTGIALLLEPSPSFYAHEGDKKIH